MADINELFRILDTDGSGTGGAPRSKAEGDAPSTDLGIIGFSFKDNAGNVVLPQLNASGELPVTTAGGGTPLEAQGTVASVIATDTQVAAITLATSTAYSKPEFNVASTRTTLWKLIWHDNGGDTTISSWITGSGQYSHCCKLDHSDFTSGAIGTQELRIIGNQLSGPISDLHGYIGILAP
jgi:hypothetical protein